MTELKPGSKTSEFNATYWFAALCIVNGFDAAWLPLNIPWDFMPWLAGCVIGYQAARGAPKTVAAYGVRQ